MEAEINKSSFDKSVDENETFPTEIETGRTKLIIVANLMIKMVGLRVSNN